MAIFTRTGSTGQISELPRVQLPSVVDGEADPLPTVLFRKLQEIINLLNGRLTFGTGVSGSRSGHIDGQWILLLSGGANVEFPIAHGLGRVPVEVFVGIPDKASIIYTARRESWTKDTIFLKSSAAATTVKILVV